MSTLALSWRFLWSRPLGAALNLLLLALGLGSITFLMLAAQQLERAFTRDLAGIDLVVGAKGSPMQLILSGVLHVDVPPGNVPLAAVQALEKNPLVAKLIPLSLGDSVQGFRIVGTTADYPALYQARLGQGQWWTQPMQAVLGAAAAQQLGLGVGAQFAGSHGMGETGASHGQAYTVVGVMAPTGSVLDRLVLTDTASVWEVHAQHDAHPEDAHDDTHNATHNVTHSDEAKAREVTMALVQYRTPLAAVTLPRLVNTSTVMQAAAPAVEITRLLSMLGLGVDVLRAFAGVLLLTAALSVFIALWSAVRERRADLALMRMLGASPRRVASVLLGESLWLALLACGAGLALGQVLLATLAWWLRLDHSLLMGGMLWPLQLLWVPVLSFGVSTLAAMVPVWSAYRSSVWALLQAR